MGITYKDLQEMAKAERPAKGRLQKVQQEARSQELENRIYMIQNASNLTVLQKEEAIVKLQHRQQTLAEKLKAFREQYNLKQSELARMIGVTMMMVSLYENNKSVPRPVIQYAINKLLADPTSNPGLIAIQEQRFHVRQQIASENEGYRIFGTNLRLVREYRKMSRYDVTKATNYLVSITDQSNYENGKSFPRAPKLIALAEALRFKKDRNGFRNIAVILDPTFDWGQLETDKVSDL